jgi:hypothetical protein
MHGDYHPGVPDVNISTPFLPKKTANRCSKRMLRSMLFSGTVSAYDASRVPRPFMDMTSKDPVDFVAAILRAHGQTGHHIRAMIKQPASSKGILL